MSVPAEKTMTPAEYLAFERASDVKHEYWSGETLEMVGASFPHNLIIGNLVGELRQKLRETRCQVCPSDLRVQLPPGDKYVYPDVSVICDEPRFADEELDTLLNPLIMVEVLSDSTEAHDRGAKAEAYRQIPSLQEYLLIAQDRRHVEKYARGQDGSWLLTEASGEAGVIHLESVDCELPLAEVYHKVPLSRNEAPRT